MNATTVIWRVLAIGDGARVELVAAELRARGYETSVARSLSEVRTVFAAADLPALVILDARASAPWRADALERITTFVRAASIRLVWIGGAGRTETRSPNVRRLPVDAPLAVIAEAAEALLAGQPAPASTPTVAAVSAEPSGPRYRRAASQG